MTEEVTGIDIVKAANTPARRSCYRYGRKRRTRIRKISASTAMPCNAGLPPKTRSKISFLTMAASPPIAAPPGSASRLDGGTAYSGAVITRFFDPLLEKVTAWAPSADEAIKRMDRALREFRIRGVATNLTFLEAVVGHPNFRQCTYNTRFIDNTPELFAEVKSADRATKLLNYIADVTVNGHPDVRGRAIPRDDASQTACTFVLGPDCPTAAATSWHAMVPKVWPNGCGHKGGPWSPTPPCRDGHQSLLATRMRTFDIANICDAYARTLPDLFSLECWGGATFDVAHAVFG